VEQRDNRDPAGARTAGNKSLPEIVADSGSDLPGETEKRIALCATCELRDSCKTPVPPGGIWHCADFR
jgi:hypothetical protein